MQKLHHLANATFCEGLKSKEPRSLSTSLCKSKRSRMLRKNIPISTRHSTFVYVPPLYWWNKKHRKLRTFDCWGSLENWTMLTCKLNLRSIAPRALAVLIPLRHFGNYKKSQYWWTHKTLFAYGRKPEHSVSGFYYGAKTRTTSFDIFDITTMILGRHNHLVQGARTTSDISTQSPPKIKKIEAWTPKC